MNSVLHSRQTAFFCQKQEKPIFAFISGKWRRIREKSPGCTGDAEGADVEIDNGQKRRRHRCEKGGFSGVVHIL